MKAIRASAELRQEARQLKRKAEAMLKMADSLNYTADRIRESYSANDEISKNTSAKVSYLRQKTKEVGS